MANGTRSVNIINALRYRGREGQWSWILHRVTGLGILAFLIIHVVETAMVIYNPALYDTLIDGYKTVLFRFAELVIFFAVIFHAMNGLRIVVQDFLPMAMRRQRELTYAAVAVTVLAMIPVTWMMLAPLVGLSDEPGTELHRERCAEQPEAPACVDTFGGEVPE